MTKRLTLTFQANTPPQWERFIKEYTNPFQHGATFPAEQMILTNARWRLMCAVQREVNLLIRYEHDEAGNDHWKILLDKWGATGDCEDLALTKRALLLEAGCPMGAVWPAMCLKDGIGHMVTVVSTKKKDFVMDIGNPDWVHDVTISSLKWQSVYDGLRWRHTVLTEDSP